MERYVWCVVCECVSCVCVYPCVVCVCCVFVCVFACVCCVFVCVYSCDVGNSLALSKGMCGVLCVSV